MKTRTDLATSVDRLGDTVLNLRILATTDLHACLTSWDYFTQKPAPNRGLSRLASLIAQCRAQMPNVILLDNGDFLTGSGLGDHMAAQFPAPLPHPMIMAMNHLGYDAVNLGNHEFSHGLPFLQHTLKDAAFPVVCSNFTIAHAPYINAHVLIERDLHDISGALHRLKIGVLGLMPKQTLLWEAANLQGMATARDMRQTAQDTAQLLRRQGADLVIAMAHSGLAYAPHHSVTEENMSHEIALLPDIDVVIAGHTHEIFPRAEDAPYDGALVMAGFFGSHLGMVDVQLHKCGGYWQVGRRKSSVLPVARRDSATGALSAIVAEDSAMLGFAAQAHREIQADLDQPIGHAQVRLHSYFATIAGSGALALVAAAQAEALAKILAQNGQAKDATPILSAVAPFKAGGRGGPENYTDCPAGPLRNHHAADLYVHPNTLVGFCVTGAELATWLERSASIFAQILPNRHDSELINADFPSFHFDVIFGVTYDIDLSQPPQFDARGMQINPAARRIVNLRYNGAPIAPHDRFVMASNSYRRDTSIGFAPSLAQNLICAPDIAIQTLVRQFIADGTEMRFGAGANWGFLPVQNASAQFCTSPKACDLLDEIAHFRPIALGLDHIGFQRFRLHF
jgi:2',3'-cyclic-nucleotide 2'-phosphodiesterase/3'-nucleotidase